MEKIEYKLFYHGRDYEVTPKGGVCFVDWEKNRLEIRLLVKQPAPFRTLDFFVPIEKKPGGKIEEHIT